MIVYPDSGHKDPVSEEKGRFRLCREQLLNYFIRTYIIFLGFNQGYITTLDYIWGLVSVLIIQTHYCPLVVACRTAVVVIKLVIIEISLTNSAGQ